MTRFSHRDNAILEPSKLKLILVTFMVTCGKMTAKSPYSDIFDPIFNLILGVNDKLDSIIQFKIIIWPVKNGAKDANLFIQRIQFKLS